MHTGAAKGADPAGTGSQVDVGYETLFHLLALAPAAYLYNSLYHWSAQYLSTTLLLAVILLGLASYVTYSFLRRSNLQTAIFIVRLPSDILLFPWRILAFMIKLLYQLTPRLVDVFVYAVKSIPSRLAKFIAGLLGQLPLGAAIAAIAGTVLGVVFAIDLGRRLFSIIPTAWLPFLLPALLVWMMLLPVGRRSWQQGNFITFTIIMWLIMLPLLPFLTIIVLLIAGALILGYLLHDAEEDSDLELEGHPT